jgi:DNA processing protein
MKNSNSHTILSSESSCSINEEQISILRLIRSENIGPATFFDLISKFGNAPDALRALQNNQKLLNSKNIKISNIRDVENEIIATQKFGADFLFFNQEHYPQSLKEIHNPPPVITYYGNYNLLYDNIIGVVGTRNASLNALNFAKKIANDLAFNKVVTISGMAKGIDSIVHSSSLDFATIAVIAGGINKIYPSENIKLADDIIKNGGLIISEQPFNAIPRNINFIQRNRIIAALSVAVIVVEAALKSGSLITAKFALDYGKEVMAVPGSPLEEKARGVNRLIKEGAILIENIDDILDVATALFQKNKIEKQYKDQKIANNPESLEMNDIDCNNDLLSNIDNNRFSEKLSDKIYQLINIEGNDIFSLINYFAVDIRDFNIAISELEINGLAMVKNQKIFKIN